MSPTPRASRYFTADGRYLPGANAPDLLRKKERILKRLRGVYEDLNAYQDAHNSTNFGCLRSGNCCRVGLVVHNAELENMARHLEQRFEEDKGAKRRVVAALKGALKDPSWTMDEGIGDLMCAFYAEGCTVYPFRPAVCRMYGVVLEINDDCPRRRLSSGREHVWIRPEVDSTIQRLYNVVDDYGEIFPRADCSRYLASGLLMMLLPRKEWEPIKERTESRFWRTLHGYRTQFVASTRKPDFTEPEAPRFPVKLLAK